MYKLCVTILQMAVTAIRQFMVFGFERATLSNPGNFEARADGSPTKNIRNEAEKNSVDSTTVSHDGEEHQGRGSTTAQHET